MSFGPRTVATFDAVMVPACAVIVACPEPLAMSHAEVPSRERRRTGHFRRNGGGYCCSKRPACRSMLGDRACC